MVGGKQVWDATYAHWVSMLKRVQSDEYDCSICDEWTYLSAFDRWVEDQDEDVGAAGIQLDKDILIPGNKVYRPEACALVPGWLNTLMQSGRGWSAQVNEGRRKPYRVKAKKLIGPGQSVHHHVGYYETDGEARSAYIEHKKDQLRFAAELVSRDDLSQGLLRHADLLTP